MAPNAQSDKTHDSVIAETNAMRLNICDLFCEIFFTKSVLFTVGRAAVGVAHSWNGHQYDLSPVSVAINIYSELLNKSKFH